MKLHATKKKFITDYLVYCANARTLATPAGLSVYGMRSINETVEYFGYEAYNDYVLPLIFTHNINFGANSGNPRFLMAFFEQMHGWKKETKSSSLQLEISPNLLSKLGGDHEH